MKNKKVFFLVGLLIGVFLVIGVSYALWQLTFRQAGTNTITTDCFKVEFSDKNPINLSDALPITDEDGKKLTPYTVTVTNICDTYARYQVNLEILDQTTLMNHSNIKVMYNEEVPIKLNEYESVETTLSNAVTSYNLGFGYIEANQSKTLNLRLWLDEDTPLSEDTMNKTLSSKVTITTDYAKKLPGTIRKIGNNELSGMWEYKTNITKLIIQNKLNKIGNAIKTSDESASKDESIMSYIVLNEDGETYTAYLQGQDMIYLNQDSSYLLRNFTKLESIEGIKYLNTSRVTNMSRMFMYCNNLTSLTLNNFDTSNVTTMNYMFYDCNKLTSLDISNFDTSKVTNMRDMFNSCSSLTSLNLSNLDTSSVTNMGSMFSNCSSLTTLNLSSFDTSNVTVMSSMFYGCKSLTNLNLSSFDTSKATSMGSMFRNCNSLTSLDVSSFDTSSVTDMGFMFNGCKSLTSLELKNFDTSSVTTMESMFSEMSNLMSLDINGFNTSKVTNMKNMFYGCKKLTTLELSSIDTTNTTDMSYIFYGCSSLISLDLSKLDTAQVTNMSNMFSNCSSLASIDLSNLDTKNVTDMSYMFYSCTSLTTLDLSSFNTSNVTTMFYMFAYCSNLTNIIYGSNFTRKTGSNINMMFYECNANIPSW